MNATILGSQPHRGLLYVAGLLQSFRRHWIYGSANCILIILLLIRITFIVLAGRAAIELYGVLVVFNLATMNAFIVYNTAMRMLE